MQRAPEESASEARASLLASYPPPVSRAIWSRFFRRGPYSHPAIPKLLERHTSTVVDYIDRSVWLVPNLALRCVCVVGILDQFDDGNLGLLDQPFPKFAQQAALDRKRKLTFVNYV